MATDLDAVLDGLKRLVDALAFELVDLRTPRDTPTGQDSPVSTPPATLQRPFMPRYVYLTNPLALDILPIDNTHEIICVSDMNNALFWNYVQENLDLDEELVKPQNERLVIDVQHLKKFGLGSLGDAKIILCYAKYSTDAFQGQTVHLPVSRKNKTLLAPNSSKRQEVNIAEAYDAQEINQQVLKKQQSDTPGKIDSRQRFITGYLAIRKWALKTGLLSSRFHLLTDKALFYLYAENFDRFDYGSPEGLDETELVPRILRGEHFRYAGEFGPRIAAPSALFHTSELSRRGHDLFVKLVLCAGQRRFQFEGLEGFLNEGPELVKVHGICWKPKMKNELQDAMTTALLGLDRRIWPYSFTDEAAGESTFLVGGYNDRVSLGHYFEGLKYDREIMALSYEHFTQEETREFVAEQSKQSTTTIDGVTAPSTSRFRTASAVMSRLRWDGTHAGTEYEVGYIDRFQDELMWKALDKWEKHTEEEEFIPEHRVMKVRRSRDGEVVWDRAQRVDKT